MDEAEFDPQDKREEILSLLIQPHTVDKWEKEIIIKGENINQKRKIIQRIRE